MSASQAAKSLDQLTWCRYAAGMVSAYLGLGVDDEKIEAIAGIIHRRLWALGSTQPAPQPEAQASPAPAPLTDAQIEQGRRDTFSTDNPFCPCDSKTMRKAVRWAERAHKIGLDGGM